MVEKILSIDEYLSKLPEPHDVPKVTQEQLLRLYRGDASGRHDEELMTEVESRLLARLELMIIVTDLSYNIRLSGNAHGPEPDDVVERDSSGEPTVVRMVDGNIVHIVTEEDEKRWGEEFERHLAGRTLGEVQDAEEIHLGMSSIDAVYDKFNRYDISPTDWGRKDLMEALRALNKTKFGSAPWGKRMISIDRVVHLAHGSGPMADMFIEDDPKDVLDFLDDLSGGKQEWTPHPIPRDEGGDEYGSPQRQPEVRVRRYWRRST